jgi:glycosyltransferase involved in cell wall biosynthesis
MLGMARQNPRRVGPDTDAHPGALGVIVAARNEGDRIEATLAALQRALPGATVWVADDASSDQTADLARRGGAQLVSRSRPQGKGANVTAAATAALSHDPAPELVLLCDADLASSATELTRLVEAVRGGECDLAVAVFEQRVGGGFGVALGFARWAIRRLCGAEPRAPISGQRAMPAEVLGATLPFAAGFGMELGMTVDAVRAGYRLGEYELPIEHRASGRTLAGFAHRARQLRDIARAYLARR